VCDMSGRFLFEITRLENAVADFERYCAGHPAGWQPVYPPRDKGLPQLFIKQGPEGELRVQQILGGMWLAWHDGKLLLGSGYPFHSCSEAQARAEAHARGWDDHVVDLAAKRRSSRKR
jgi:hypothetical protein